MKLNKTIIDNKEVIVLNEHDIVQLQQLFNEYVNTLVPDETGSIKVSCDYFFSFVETLGV